MTPPPTWDRERAIVMARGAFASVAIWVALTTLTRVTGPTALHQALDLPFHLVCHRLPERVLAIAGVPLPFCSRCTGLWLGFSVSAALAWPRVPMRALRVVLPIALALMAIEVLTQDLGLHPVFHPTRLLTGLGVSVPFGGALGALVTRELRGGAGALEKA
jgi:uncharacterized membrane protein